MASESSRASSDTSADSGSSEAPSESEPRAQEEPDVVFPWLSTMFHTDTVDAARIAPCFSSPLCVRSVLKDVAMLMQRVEEVEPSHIESTRFHFTQLLHYLYLRPTRENGNALMRWIDCVRRSMDFRLSWPKEPLADERLGTILEGVDQIIFQHSSEGLIRLHWMNPLPTPAWLQHGGYQCDICFNPDLRTGYQHVNEDNARDHSRLLEQRTGYDACATCAVKHLLENRQAVRSWGCQPVPSTSLFEGPDAMVLRCCEGQEQLRLSVSQVAGTRSVEVEVLGSIGHNVAVAALPMDSELPAAWLGTGRKMMHPSEAPRTVEPSSTIVQLRCLKSGVLFRFAPGNERGSLRCWALQTDETIFGEEHFIQALSLVEREEGGAVRLAWRKGPAGEGATLPATELEALRLLATWAGCLHNLPPPPTAPAARRSDAQEAMASFERQGPGVRGAFLQSPELEPRDCAICLSGLLDQTWVRGAPVQTRCGHHFHALCLRRHLRASAKDGARSHTTGVCPNCRAPHAGSATSCGALVQRWRIDEDTQGKALCDGPYRFLAVLCTDPEAVVDSAIVMTQTVLKLSTVESPSHGYGGDLL